MNALDKAGVLIESLPYIRRWAGKTAVIKVGGEILDSEESTLSFATDIVLLRHVGINPVVVHGGGRQISDAMREAGIEPVFAAGLRVTDDRTIEIVRRVLIDEVNAGLAGAIRQQGGDATAVSGEDGPLFVVRQSFGPEGEDLGFVGEIEKVNSSELLMLLGDEKVPVVASLGWGPGGTHNINADTAAAALAGSLQAEKIVFLTNVAGLYHDLGDESTLISEITAAELEEMLASGRLSEGMVPKIAGAVDAIKSGVPQVHILDGRVPHAILLEIFTEQGIGTMVLP